MKDLNAGFLLDIWQDLKEKRLAPVAIGLVVALVAIPAVMMKGDGAASDVPLPLPVAAPSDGGEVVVAEERAGGSKLGSYKARDPFKGLHKGAAAPAAGTGGGAATAPPVSSGSTGSTGSTGSAGSTLPGTTGGSTGGSGSAPSGGSAPPAKAPPATRKPRFFNFRLDVDFGRPGREKRYASLSRLSFLEGGGVPIALFLGVNEAQTRALFVVYPALNHQGEGKCIPKPTKCNFLSLDVGGEHYFSANDREYRIKLRAIKRVASSEDEKERHVARKAAQRSARTGDGGVSAGTGAEPHDWPLLVDSAG